MKVAVIDYGMGNIQSLSNSLEYLGAEVHVTSKHEELKNFSTFFLPGVGSFKLAVDNLKKLNLFDEIKNQVLIKKENTWNMSWNAAFRKFKYRKWFQ